MGLFDILKKKQARKILVIDDEMSVVITVSANLRTRGFEVKGLTKAQEADSLDAKLAARSDPS